MRRVVPRLAKPANRVRIIGGAWRSRVLRFPAVADLRPTPDRVRETLFNWLGQDLTGRRCLDLFAGSGALGFEALSRGAAEVVMVERSRAALAALRENGAQLGVGDRGRFVFGDALHFLDSPGETGFDVVFVDPPYGRGLADAVLARLPGCLARDALVYVESDSRVVPAPPWRVRRHGRAGAVHYHLIEWGAHDHGSLSGDV
jgi:16S rRNA (guanine966-N2)-methyltransferase